MIPQFPSFKKLELSDKEDFVTYTRQFEPYSDYNFVSLYCYNTDRLTEISFLNNNLVVLFQDYLTDEPFYSFLGKNNILDTTNKLIIHAKKNQFTTILKLIPQVNIQSLDIDTNKIVIEEDKDNHDYILSVNELAEFKGGKYYDKRNLVNRFKRMYPNYSVNNLDLQDEKTKKTILNFFYIWEEKRNKKRAETERELGALQRLLESSSYLTTVSQGIYVEGKMIAFTIKELLHNNYAIIHFEKNDISYQGISSLLRQESAKYLQKLKYEYINYEQDLGVEGLRKAKSLWHPILFLKKYKISEK